MMNTRAFNDSVTYLNSDLMDPDFLKLQFPRFYSYDILRGLHFIARWRNYRKNAKAIAISDAVIAYGVEILQSKLNDGMLWTERSDLIRARTKNMDETGEWTIVKHSSTFPLLSEVNTPGKTSPFLTQQFEEIME